MVVGFLPESYRVSEAEAVVTITIVKRTQAARRVTLQVSTEDGSAMCKLLAHMCTIIGAMRLIAIALQLHGTIPV